ncbi:MAG TPA: SIS domain-containing protein [Patescibacteria group bacterium]|nr:SIS domain-containing protein [Patescibacteria group bacterium]
MFDLKDLNAIRKLDPKNVYDSTELFTKQCEQIWMDAKKIEFPQEYKAINNVILCGMGGSAYGGYVAQALLKDKLPAFVYSNNDYHLPAFANKKSLVVLSSYSGSTEEVLSCAKEAYEKDLLVTVVTNGGALKKLIDDHNGTGLVFDPKFNPSGQPRLGTGYMVLGFIALLNRLGLVSLSDEAVMAAVHEVKENQQKVKEDAMTIAQKLFDTLPVIFSSDFLNGNAHIMRNQLNETAKSFSAFEDVPELNHHLMEGLQNPKEKKLHILFLLSDLYDAIHKKRMKLTQDVVEKNHVEISSYAVPGKTRLSQMLTTLSFGGYVSLYLALLYGLDPSLIPWVDYFKEQLGK